MCENCGCHSYAKRMKDEGLEEQQKQTSSKLSDQMMMNLFHTSYFVEKCYKLMAGMASLLKEQYPVVAQTLLTLSNQLHDESEVHKGSNCEPIDWKEAKDHSNTINLLFYKS